MPVTLPLLHPAAASRYGLSLHCFCGCHLMRKLQLLSPAPSPMKPLPSPSRASLPASSSTAHSGTSDQGYNPAVYAADTPQTSTFSSFRSSPPAPAGSFRSHLSLHQLQERDSDAEQQFDDMLQAERVPVPHPRHRPASPVAVSQDEAAALKMELQASPCALPLPSILRLSRASPLMQRQGSQVAQLQQQLKALQARRPSPERVSAPNQPPAQLRTAADIAAHEEVRALQAALASAHARNGVLEVSARCITVRLW